MGTSNDQIEIDALLRDLGFSTDEALEKARAVLERAGLTSARKQRIALAKREKVERLLGEKFEILCQTCFAAVGKKGEPEPLVGAPKDCRACGGKKQKQAIDAAVRELASCGIGRLVIVGGSPETHTKLRDLVQNRLELRLVSGTERRTSREANADLGWADVVFVWASTELDHKVSHLYTQDHHKKVVTCSRRSIEALAAEMSKWAQGLRERARGGR
jgi:hypothetical protein